jgi:phosphorylase/glycogen(starch) synthase
MSYIDNENFLFEISWEVCNKVGGIYTVLTSKLSKQVSTFKNYFAIGPYIKGRSEYEFKRKEVPEKFKGVISKMNSMGIGVHYGSWLKKGNPNVFLIEHQGYSYKTNEIKGKLWEYFKIDSLGSNWHDFDDVMLWAWCCGEFVNEFGKHMTTKVIVHSHEWMAGIANLAVKILNSSNGENFRTIFTTHATVLGRALSSRGRLPIDACRENNPEDLASEINVHTKHQTEKALAHNSDCFTTISEITSNECEVIFGKKADVIVPNGIAEENLILEEEVEKKFWASRKKTLEFFKKHFSQFFKTNLDDVKILFTSGRNEFINKGMDVFISSLGKLNDELKSTENPQEVLSLFLIPIGDFGLDPFIEQLMKGNHKDTKIISQLGGHIMPYSTHMVPADNPIIESFIKAKLFNQKDDKVKVVVLPFYLNGRDGIINRRYREFITGLDLGVFPSFYEPWGYTPQEAIGFGVPAVASDLSGFGKFVLGDDLAKASVVVLNRGGKSNDEASSDLSMMLRGFVTKPMDQLVRQKKWAIPLAKEVTWEHFYQFYLNAYNSVVR